MGIYVSITSSRCFFNNTPPRCLFSMVCGFQGTDLFCAAKGSVGCSEVTIERRHSLGRNMEPQPYSTMARGKRRGPFLQYRLAF